MYEPEVNVKYFLQLLSTLFLEAESLTALGLIKRSGLLTGEPQGFSCQHLLDVSITGVSHNHSFLHRWWVLMLTKRAHYQRSYSPNLSTTNCLINTVQSLGRMPKLAMLAPFPVMMAGYWKKFSTNVNLGSGELYWLQYHDSVVLNFIFVFAIHINLLSKLIIMTSTFKCSHYFIAKLLNLRHDKFNIFSCIFMPIFICSLF